MSAFYRYRSPAKSNCSSQHNQKARRHQRKIEKGNPCYCCWSPLSDARGLRRQLARCRIESRGPSGLKRRAKPPGCPARSRRSQTRRAGCNGSGGGGGGLRTRRRLLIELGSGLRRPSPLPHVLQACFRGSVEERHRFDDVCSGVRLGSSSSIGLSRNAVPRGIWGG